MRAVRIFSVVSSCGRALLPTSSSAKVLLISPRLHPLLRQQSALLRTSSIVEDEEKQQSQKREKMTPNISEEDKARLSKRFEAVKASREQWPFHMSMTEEQKKHKKERIEAANAEDPPPGLFGKVKFYLRRYWYIAVPAHAVSCSFWFGCFYALVSSGVDIPAMLAMLHMPEWIISKVQETPASAGVIVVALILYKIATPLRYATTLVLIQGIFSTLKRMGKLRTAREVEYRVRTDYEKMKLATRKAYDQRGLGVRQFTKEMAQKKRKD